MTNSPIIGAENAGKLVLPPKVAAHDRDRTLFIVCGADIINMLRRLTQTPKAALMESVYNVKYADSEAASAPLPKSPGEYPVFAVKLMVTQRQYFEAKVYTSAQRYRTQMDDANGQLITYLGFDPVPVAETAPTPEVEKAREN